MRPWLYGVALLVAGVAHNVLYRRMQPDDQGYVYTLTGALLMAWLLLTVAKQMRSVTVWLVVGLLVGHSFQVAGCNAWFLVAPWPLDSSDDLCSDGMGLPLGVLGIVAAALVQGAHRG